MSDVICSLEDQLGSLSLPHRRDRAKATSKRLCFGSVDDPGGCCELNAANSKDEMYIGMAVAPIDVRPGKSIFATSVIGSHSRQSRLCRPEPKSALLHAGN